MKRETGRPPAKVIASTHRPFPVAAKARNQDPGPAAPQRLDAVGQAQAQARPQPAAAAGLDRVARHHRVAFVRYRSPASVAGFWLCPPTSTGVRPQGPCKPPLGLRASPVPRVPGSAADRPQGSPNSARPFVLRFAPAGCIPDPPPVASVRNLGDPRPQPAPWRPSPVEDRPRVGLKDRQIQA